MNEQQVKQLSFRYERILFEMSRSDRDITAIRDAIRQFEREANDTAAALCKEKVLV
jgi:hypothetical protein